MRNNWFWCVALWDWRWWEEQRRWLSRTATGLLNVTVTNGPSIFQVGAIPGSISGISNAIIGYSVVSQNIMTDSAGKISGVAEVAITVSSPARFYTNGVRAYMTNSVVVASTNVLNVTGSIGHSGPNVLVKLRLKGRGNACEYTLPDLNNAVTEVTNSPQASLSMRFTGSPNTDRHIVGFLSFNLKTSLKGQKPVSCPSAAAVIKKNITHTPYVSVVAELVTADRKLYGQGSVAGYACAGTGKTTGEGFKLRLKGIDGDGPNLSLAGTFSGTNATLAVVIDSASGSMRGQRIRARGTGTFTPLVEPSPAND